MAGDVIDGHARAPADVVARPGAPTSPAAIVAATASLTK